MHLKRPPRPGLSPFIKTLWRLYDGAEEMQRRYAELMKAR